MFHTVSHVLDFTRYHATIKSGGSNPHHFIMQTLYIPTSSAEYLAQNILKKSLNCRMVTPARSKNDTRHFPDGEVYMKLLPGSLPKKSVAERIVVLHTGAPNPNDGLVELELLLQILRDSDVKPDVFFSYFPYSMQDAIFEAGETNAAENIIEKLIHYYNVKNIYVIDPHFEGRKWLKQHPIVVFSARSLLIEKAKKAFGNDIFFVSPDAGGKRRTGIAGFKKERINSFDIKMEAPKVNFAGKVVAVVDDMIKTGNTLLHFYEIAKRARAEKVIALVTHGVTPAGVTAIAATYDHLYLTNSVDLPEANVDLTDLIVGHFNR